MRITLQSRFTANNTCILLMRSNAASVNMTCFPELSENDLACLLESKNSKNTKKQLKMNDKTIIELGYHKISWHRQITDSSPLTNHDILLNLVQ
jgi:hypothetical protein